jgi:hypothetical protein
MSTERAKVFRPMPNHCPSRYRSALANALACFRAVAPASCLSAFACAAVVFPFSGSSETGFSDIFLLGPFGTSQFGLDLLLLTLGSRLIPASRASLLANLELPVAPFWVWLAFGELPSAITLIGGAIVCAIVAAAVGAALFATSDNFSAHDCPRVDRSRCGRCPDCRVKGPGSLVSQGSSATTQWLEIFWPGFEVGYSGRGTSARTWNPDG